VKKRARANPVKKATLIVAGTTVTAAGLCMIFLPGPAFIVLPVGIGLLAGGLS